MKGLVWFLAGVGVAAALARFASWRYVRVQERTVDLNSGDRQQFLGLGLNEAAVDRILDNRPYRSRMDLLSRFVVSDSVYREIKDRLSVNEQAAHRAVGIA